LQQYQSSLLIINKEILERIERAKRFNYNEDEDDAGGKDDGNDEGSKDTCQYSQIILDLAEAGLKAGEYEYYEAFRLSEDIRCAKLRKSIFESLGYVKKTTTVNVGGVSMMFRKLITKDTIGTDYSIHLSEIMTAVSSKIEAQGD